MSSVKDRVRNLQQSTASPPSASVAECAQAVERKTDPNAERQQSLSQLTKQFDATAVVDPIGGLGARVARFDSDSSQTLQDRVRRLESEPSSLGTLSARSSVFDQGSGSVRDVAERFGEHGKKGNDERGALHEARARFESRNTNSVGEKAGLGGNDSQNKVTSRTAQKSDATQAFTANEGVFRRAAVFEQAQQNDATSEQKKAGVLAGPSKVNDKKSLKEEMEDVRRVNGELVSMLLELTSAFRRLETTRDELQKRVAELEKK